MVMDTINFDLVTPEAMFFSGAVHQIDIPGALGEFGVLVGHMPLISTMKMGVVKIYAGKDLSRRIFVAGGVAEVNPASCTILAERAFDLDLVVRADIEKSLAKARDALDKAVEEAAKADAAREVEVTQALIAALQ